MYDEYGCSHKVHCLTFEYLFGEEFVFKIGASRSENVEQS